MERNPFTRSTLARTHGFPLFRRPAALGGTPGCGIRLRAHRRRPPAIEARAGDRIRRGCDLAHLSLPAKRRQPSRKQDGRPGRGRTPRPPAVGPMGDDGLAPKLAWATPAAGTTNSPLKQALGEIQTMETKTARSDPYSRGWPRFYASAGRYLRKYGDQYMRQNFSRGSRRQAGHHQ